MICSYSRKHFAGWNFRLNNFCRVYLCIIYSFLYFTFLHKLWLNKPAAYLNFYKCTRSCTHRSTKSKTQKSKKPTPRIRLHSIIDFKTYTKGRIIAEAVKVKTSWAERNTLTCLLSKLEGQSIYEAPTIKAE